MIHLLETGNNGEKVFKLESPYNSTMVLYHLYVFHFTIRLSICDKS
jgi:hypothetical protein